MWTQVCEHMLRDAQCQQERRHPALQRTAQLLGPAAQAGRYPSTPEMCVSEPEQVQPQNRGWESFLVCFCLGFVFGSLYLSLSIPGMLTTYPSFWFKAESAQFFWKADCSFRFRWRFFPASPRLLLPPSVSSHLLVSSLAVLRLSAPGSTSQLPALPKDEQKRTPQPQAHSRK